MRIYNNVASLTAYNNLTRNNSGMDKAMERLSTGLRINSAKDDPAGLAQSTNLRAAIAASLAAAEVSDGAIEFLSVADGALATAGEAVTQMIELNIRGGDGSLNSRDAADIAIQYNNLAGEVAQMLGGNTSTGTMFNGAAVFGTAVRTFIVDATGNTYTIATLSLGSAGVTLGAASTIGSGSFGSALATALNTVLTAIATQRAYIGGDMTRLQMKSDKNVELAQNMQSFESRLRDADMAKEAASFTRYQILVQSTTSMLAQANARPSSILSLLQ